MKKPVKTNFKFKDYSLGQTLLLPPSLGEMIEANHPVRVVNRVIDQIEIDSLIDKFKGGGTSSYHPRMLLKVVVFAYLSNCLRSGRSRDAVMRPRGLSANTENRSSIKKETALLGRLHFIQFYPGFYCKVNLIGRLN
jgi:hypothetical protein